jgi:prepilin signal peptidase PulO-like enzyme (type II secretory pathway)
MTMPTRREIDLSTFRPLEIKLFAVALTLILAIVGYIFDLLVLRGSHSMSQALVFSNALTGALAGVLIYRLLAEIRRKQIAFIFRMTALADLNQLAAQASVVAEELEVKEDAKRRLADLEHTLTRLRQTVAELIPLADY